MKDFKHLTLALLVLFTFSKATSQTKKIDVSKSKITWIGQKITGKHQGTIDFKDGYLLFKDNVLAGGSFVADMTSLTNTDQTGKSKNDLEGHLKSDDFFGVYNFKTAKLDFITVANKGNNTYSISANLTLKGITNPVKFDLLVKNNTATANLFIDRTKYDIKYGSGSYFSDLGDRTIYNEFELIVMLSF
ncbi:MULTISPECIES: YceI family protein [unclassified Flavobacterium]|uniref:YceI family protein n=1 Tax=unclassified Flavobacterium TaxID=196869 RepID=UPI003F93D485